MIRTFLIWENGRVVYKTYTSIPLNGNQNMNKKKREKKREKYENKKTKQKSKHPRSVLSRTHTVVE